MYEIKNDQTSTENFFAGKFPVVTAVKTVATGKTVKKYEPVKITTIGIEPVVTVAASEKDATNIVPAKTAFENTTANIYGIAADAAAAGEEVVVYLTGDFFADALTLQSGVTVETIKPALRKLGIFLK